MGVEGEGLMDLTMMKSKAKLCCRALHMHGRSSLVSDGLRYIDVSVVPDIERIKQIGYISSVRGQVLQLGWMRSLGASHVIKVEATGYSICPMVRRAHLY